MSKSMNKGATSSKVGRPVAKLSATSNDNNEHPASKQSQVITLLQGPSGATIAAMAALTGWQTHSVRGFLAGVVRKRFKLKLGSKKVEGNRIYQISGGAKHKSAARRTRSQPR